MRPKRIAAMFLPCLLACACAPPTAVTPDAPPLGAAHLPSHCAAALQPRFDRAVALLHHMTYPQARAAFADIAERDPGCAMARWGLAMTLFQPLWPTRPTRADLERGWALSQEGLALAADDVDAQGWLRTVAGFFREPQSADYFGRLDAWAQALADLHASRPDDVEVAAFRALALLATARPGPALREHSDAAVALLRPILRANPQHPGAMHYIVHADDIPGRESADLDVVRRYEQVAPDNPHALHMPTHIYTRLGDWDSVVRGNLRAAAAALKSPAGAHGEWVWDEYPHATEYLVYAYLQLGDDDAARARIDALRAIPNLEPSTKTAFHIASTRARYALERGAWAEAAALDPREPAGIDWDRFPWAEAVGVFARGYGALHAGDRERARSAVDRLQQLEARAGAGGETVFARQIAMLLLDLSGVLAHADGDDGGALERLREALRLEGDTPKPAVTPAATLPAGEILGDLLMALGRPGDALAAYRQALQAFPHRFNGTLGVARAAAASGDSGAANAAWCELARLAKPGTRAARLTEVDVFRRSQALGHCPREPH
jgi:tetratricopeptide (TPR) repeat protein